MLSQDISFILLLHWNWNHYCYLYQLLPNWYQQNLHLN